ncbi:MAG TPA: T9SS type A sorting domain-containing protein [Bacteroidia bacterium]|nr:T9SS type A sorting domain-containing protein [Bacteroidia bacterium]
MKKHLLIVALFCLGAIASKAQSTLINPGFETWTNDAVATGTMDPNTGTGTTGWWDFNFFNNTTFFGTPQNPVTVFRNSDTVHSGTYSALIESGVYNTSTYSTIKSLGANYPDTLGILISGNVNASFSGIAVKLGEPFSNRITSYTFNYQYYPHIKDTASCSVVLSHFSGGKRNTLGAGYIKMTAVNTWTLGTVPIFYDSTTGNPDTIFIVYNACSTLRSSIPQPGSKLYLDDAGVVLGIDNINAPTVNVNVYPNPASTEVNFQVTSPATQVTRADIYDITGQKVNSYDVRNNFLTMSTQGYASGLYFYQLYDKDGVMVKSGKFSIAGK